MISPLTKFIEQSFGDGPCQCIRCRNNGTEAGYEWKHTFHIAGKVYRRRFALSTVENFEAAMWDEYYRIFKDAPLCNLPNKMTPLEFLGEVDESIFDRTLALWGEFKMVVS